MRIVLDSNIWISALVFGGAPRRVIERAISEGIVLVSSAEISSEVHRILRRKFPEFVDDFDALQAALSGSLLSVPLGAVTIDACRDPDDNRILETAVIGTAAAIISGDKDLLVLGRYEAIAILTASQWLAESIP